MNTVIDELGKILKDGGSITLPNFGTFSVKERAVRKGRNPRTGDPIDISATKVVPLLAVKEFETCGSKEVIKNFFQLQ